MTIEDQSASLVSIAEKLDPILHTLNDQLETFSELRQRAHEAFPFIEGRLNNLTTEFSNVVQIAIPRFIYEYGETTYGTQHTNRFA